MAGQLAGNIPLSKINPQFLDANSTSHTWAFSAIAELIDNAYDPDVSAKHIWIDQTTIDSMDCLTFTDDGAGLNYDAMLKMMSFGFTDKKIIRGHAPVGQYGNGFKSGSMRLGKDVIVFSKNRDTMSVGLLSQTYLAAIRAQHIIVPIAIFRQDGDTFSVVPDYKDSLKAILEYSLFKTEKDLLRELQAINTTSSGGSTGTRIIIWNLRRTKEMLEFDFKSDRYDIKIPRTDSGGSNNPQELRENVEPECSYSLRAYCSILYLKPRMQIIIRGKKVQTQLVSKSLAHTRKDRYTPQFLGKRKSIPITFGYDPGNKNSGIMLYYKKRLIKAYERVGCQCRSVPKGVGIIGIIECDFLKPTHNKQDFDDTDEHRKVKRVLGEKLEEYWNEMRHLRQTKDPKFTTAMENVEKSADQNWVQCDTCQKWRKMPDGVDVSKLSELWYCYQNQDPNYRTCIVDEELADSEEDLPYKKTYKQGKKQQREKNRQQTPQTAEDVTSTSCTPVTPSPCAGASPYRSDSEQQEGTTATPRGRNGSGQNETPTRATPRIKRQLYPTPGIESAKRPKVAGESASSSTGTEVVSGSDPLGSQGAPSDLIAGDTRALPFMAQKGNNNQHLSDGALPNEPMETNAAPISTSPTSAVTTQANGAGPLREQAEQERITSLGQDRPKSLKQTRRQQGHSVGVHRPLLDMAAEEQNRVQKQLEMATAERDQYRQQLEEAKQERDQCKTQLVVANQERDQNRGQMEAANQERDQHRMQLEAAKQERDKYKRQLLLANQEKNQNRGQMEAANQERDQYKTQLEAAKQERDQYKRQLAAANQESNRNKGQVEAANQERDQCRKQLEAANQERDQCRMQLEAANQERDQQKTQLEAAKQERDQYKRQIVVANQMRKWNCSQIEAANKERDQYRLQLEAAKQERDQHKCLLEAAIQEKDQYKDQAETANLERDRYRGQAETATLDRDQYRNQVETANRVKDQYNKQLGATNQEIDRYKGQAEVANLERDQYREQAKIASRERDQFMDQVETVTRERDQYIANLNQIKRALGQMRPGEVRQESCDQVPKGEDSLTMTWDSVLEDLNCCRGEMVQLKSKCEEQRRELEDLRGAGSSIVSPRPAQSTEAGPSQPVSSEAERLKGLRVTVSRLLPILIPGLELDQDQVNYENTVIDEILEQYVDGVTYSGAG